MNIIYDFTVMYMTNIWLYLLMYVDLLELVLSR